LPTSQKYTHARTPASAYRNTQTYHIHSTHTNNTNTLSHTHTQRTQSLSHTQHSTYTHTHTHTRAHARKNPPVPTGSSCVVMPRDENSAMSPPLSMPPTPMTSALSAGLFRVPHRGPSLPMALTWRQHLMEGGRGQGRGLIDTYLSLPCNTRQMHHMTFVCPQVGKIWDASCARAELN
jgi:hypothetical protein